MMLSREAWNQTHGFDEDFFMYGEDIDLCFRAKQAGFKVYYVNTTATVHFKGEFERGAAPSMSFRCFMKLCMFSSKSITGHPSCSRCSLGWEFFLRRTIVLTKKYRSLLALWCLII